MNENTLTRETGRSIAGALNVPLADLWPDPDAGTGFAVPLVAHPIGKLFRDAEHEIVGEAHRMGASVEDMDYIHASLADPETMVRLFEDSELQRPLTDEEQREEIEALRDELLAWVKRRIELRERRRAAG